MLQKVKLSEELEMVVLEEVFAEIRATVGSERAETGGVLLGSRDDYIVKKFIFDPHGSRFSAGYDPDVVFLNKVIKSEWEKNKLALLGFVHSHPRGVRRLSGDWGNGIGDLGYTKKIFAAIPKLKKFLVPIVYSCYDGGPFAIFPYVAIRDRIEDYQEAILVIPKPVDEALDQTANPYSSRVEDVPNETTFVAQPEVESSRIVDTYRTLDGKAEFTFRFVRFKDRYEADIVDMPTYGERSEALHCTHRKQSPRGGFQADLAKADCPVTFESVRQMAAHWAESTWRYIQHNERFNP